MGERQLLKQAEEEGESLGRAKVGKKSKRQVRWAIELLAPVKANSLLSCPRTTPRPHPGLGGVQLPTSNFFLATIPEAWRQARALTGSPLISPGLLPGPFYSPLLTAAPLPSPAMIVRAQLNPATKPPSTCPSHKRATCLSHRGGMWTGLFFWQAAPGSHRPTLHCHTRPWAGVKGLLQGVPVVAGWDKPRGRRQETSWQGLARRQSRSPAVPSI